MSGSCQHATPKTRKEEKQPPAVTEKRAPAGPRGRARLEQRVELPHGPVQRLQRLAVAQAHALPGGRRGAVARPVRQAVPQRVAEALVVRADHVPAARQRRLRRRARVVGICAVL